MIYWFQRYWYVIVGIFLTLLGFVCWWIKDYVASLKSQVRISSATNEVLHAIAQQKPAQDALVKLASAKDDADTLETSLETNEEKNDAQDATEGDDLVKADLDKRGLR